MLVRYLSNETSDSFLGTLIIEAHDTSKSLGDKFFQFRAMKSEKVVQKTLHVNRSLTDLET
jgi:hypothetical protein